MKWEPQCSTRGREHGQPWIQHSCRHGWELRMFTHRLKTVGGFSTRRVKSFENFDECLKAAWSVPIEYQPAWWPFDYFTDDDIKSVESGARTSRAVFQEIQNGSRGTYEEQLSRINRKDTGTA